MIQEFTVKNFRSFKDKVTLSFEATRDTTFESSHVVEVAPGVRLLRLRTRAANRIFWLLSIICVIFGFISLPIYMLLLRAFLSCLTKLLRRNLQNSG